MKELYPKDIKRIVHEEITTLLRKNKKEFQSFRYLLEPKQLKAEIRKIMVFQLNELVVNEVKERIGN